jgi:hypothetical protein
MWSDNQTDKDFLNFKCVADTAAELIILSTRQKLNDIDKHYCLQWV